MYILFSGFRGTYRPPALPSDGLEDNVPDVHDEADFDIPDTQAVLERLMSNMSKQADDEYRSLSALLDSLPDPSSFTTAKSMTAAAAREKGVIPEADEEMRTSISSRVWRISQTTRTCSFAFFAITAAVDCCSSTNSCWKTWLARGKLAQFKWIELEWKRP